MHLPIYALLGLTVAGSVACSPTFNWREVRIADSGLTALLPCKPDQAVRPVAIATPSGPVQMDLHMQGCDAGGATFAVAFANAPATTLDPWRIAQLATLRAATSQSAPQRVDGASPLPPPQKVTATGQRADGGKVESQTVYFAKGPLVFQAVILADRISPDVAETFFSGLKLQ